MVADSDQDISRPAAFRHIDHLLELDGGPGRHRIGLLALANDYVVERDFMNMRPRDEVMVFVSRIHFEGDCSIENLAALAPRVAAAASLVLPGGRLDSMVFACTSGAALIGHEGVEAAIHEVRPGIPCITPVRAALAAFDRLAVRRVAVLAPYSDAVTGSVLDALRAGGLEIVKASNFNITASDDISAVTPASIRAGAVEADCPDADALFIACTDFRSAEVLERIETETGKPVVTANQAMFWAALRCAGYGAAVAGYGRLFTL